MSSDEARARRERIFRELERVAGDDGLIDPAGFGRAVGRKNSIVMDRLFALFDADGDGKIHAHEFVGAIEALGEAGGDARLAFAFDIYDLDGDGFIVESEFRELMVASLAEQGLVIGAEKQEALVRAFFTKADVDLDGSISRAEFHALMETHPGMRYQLELYSLSWLDSSGPPRLTVMTPPDRLRRQLKHLLQNHPSGCALASLWALANVALFLHAMSTYSSEGASLAVQIARGGGACLNLNGALILLPMLRSFWTAVRSTRAGRYLPVDELVAIHEIIAYAIVLFTGVHVVAHLINYAQSGASIPVALTQTKAGVTGVVITVILILMAVFAHRRRGKPGRFEWFTLTHSLYGLWVIGLLLHGPVFWKWAAIPLVGYAAERLFRHDHRTHATRVLEAKKLPSRVTRLHMRRPDEFQFQAGDFAFVRIPRISRSEWHPFTISSAPENAEFLEMHVRTVGDWTQALYELADRAGEGEEPIELDGPYGTPSQRVFESDVAVLVGAGIGVTPFASMLHSVLWRKRLGLLPPDKRFHFFWISRTQRCFEWFAFLLGELERSGAREQIDINIHMTGFVPDLTSVAVEVAIDSLYADNPTDVITGLRARTRTGRPDWDEIGANLADLYPGRKVEVFFCGPPGLGAKVRRMCRKYGLVYRAERF